MSTTLLKLQDIGLKFSGQSVFNRENLFVHKAERVVVVGPSGSGKSCLLKILAGLLPPQQGSYFFDQSDFYSSSMLKRNVMMKKMGMLFQQNALFDSLSVLENVCFPLRETTSKTDSEILLCARELLEQVGLSESESLMPNEISGGMQKRVGIARALALNPEVLFYDDPTAGLDPITSRKIINMICDFQKNSQSTVVAVTNDVNRAFQMAQRIYMLWEGEILSTGTPEETATSGDSRVQQFIHAHQVKSREALQ